MSAASPENHTYLRGSPSTILVLSEIWSLLPSLMWTLYIITSFFATDIMLALVHYCCHVGLAVVLVCFLCFIVAYCLLWLRLLVINQLIKPWQTFGTHCTLINLYLWMTNLFCFHYESSINIFVHLLFIWMIASEIMLCVIQRDTKRDIILTAV